MNSDKKVVVSKVMDVLKGLSISDGNKLILLMPFGLILGHINTDEPSESAEPAEVILLRDAEILPFVGNRVNIPILTVLPDQILGLSLGNLGS